MGYPTTGRFVENRYLFDSCGMGAGASICALGDQTVPIKTQQDLDYIKQFIEYYGRSYHAERYTPFLGRELHVSAVYRDAGFAYVSVDVNGKDDALTIDLNEWPNSDLPDEQYDIVTNHGTTEHLANQLSAHAIVHYLTKPNGLIIHHVPVLHCSAHAMTVVTPLFYKKLIDGNRYEVVQALIRAHEIGIAVGFHHAPELEFIEGFTQAIQESTLGAMVWLVLRKTSDAAFVPPIDVGADDAQLRPIIQRYIEKYSGTATEAQKEQALDRYLSPDPAPTETIVNAIAGPKKQIDPGRGIGDSTTAEHNRFAPTRTSANPWPPAAVQPKTVTLKLPAASNKQLIAIGMACGVFLFASSCVLLVLVRFVASLPS